MVKSKINPDKVIYNETKSIDEGDIGYASSVYEIELYNNDIEIVLGREKYTYSEHGIIYYTIYLLLGGSPVARIGVFEIESNNLISILDEDNDIDLSKGNILLFDNEEYIIKKINEYKESHQHLEEVDEEVEVIEKKEESEHLDEPENETHEDDSDDDATRFKIPENKKSKENEQIKEQLKNGLFMVDDSINKRKLLSEETEEDSDKMKRDYVENARNSWIQQFMKNDHYDLLDVPGDGDCFFHTLVEAYAQIGHKTTTEKLRSALADEVTDETYQQYRTLYVNFLGEIQAKEKEMKDAKKIIAELKKRSEKTSDKEESNSLLKEAKNMVEQYNKFKIQKEDTKEMISEFDFMEGVDSYEKFKGAIMKRDFWADTWAISTLEKKLNMKCIILSEEAYKNGDLDSVLQCGQLNDDITNVDNYSPEYYIIVSHHGNHYQLISYKEKHILKYPEIPYDIKALIINKCMEKNAGPYYLIKDFRNLKTKLGLSPDEGAPMDDENEDIQMYDPETIFMFYSKSANAKAGKGSGEKINKNRFMDFNTLNKDKVCEDWRKKLDDDWIAPFKIDGKRWASVEHYFLGCQYKKGYPDIYATFSLDSETDISKDVAMAKQAAKKSNKLKSKQKVPDHVKIDADFFEVGVNPRYIEERKRALVAKFTQNLDLKKVLMETRNAKLMQFKRGDTPKIDDLLMKVRLAIADGDKSKK
jgi:predicted NAD-dependent protein-ADP-ribosyltransferase YbiA (DUF1768 family)